METTFETIVIDALMFIAFTVGIGFAAFIIYILVALGIEFIKWIISILKSRKNGNK